MTHDEEASRDEDAFQSAKFPSTPPSAGPGSGNINGHNQGREGYQVAKGVVTTIDVDSMGPLL
eukprot:1504179-Pyramimonas_sp.AAC.1